MTDGVLLCWDRGTERERERERGGRSWCKSDLNNQLTSGILDVVYIQYLLIIDNVVDV